MSMNEISKALTVHKTDSIYYSPEPGQKYGGWEWINRCGVKGGLRAGHWIRVTCKECLKTKPQHIKKRKIQVSITCRYCRGKGKRLVTKWK